MGMPPFMLQLTTCVDAIETAPDAPTRCVLRSGEYYEQQPRNAFSGHDYTYAGQPGRHVHHYLPLLSIRHTRYQFFYRKLRCSARDAASQLVATTPKTPILSATPHFH